MSDLEQLGERVGKALEHRYGDERVLATVKARFHRAVGQKRVPERRVWLAFAGGAALAAAAVLAFLWIPRGAPSSPLSVAVRGREGAGADFVSARAADQAVDFSDGSEVVVRKGSQLRVSAVTPDGAFATLERGSAHVSVVHREKTKWVFTAGPYRVHVVGTRFELSWNPDTTGLQVQMEDGAVEVEGPGLTRQRVAGTGRLELFAENTDETAASEPASARPPSRPRAKPAPAAVAPPAHAQGAPTWRYLAETGDAAGAVAAAEQAGFSSLAGSLVQHDVLLLGDAAREARKPARAIEAYQAVRERFPGSPAAIDAALRIGKMFSEDNHDDVTAAKWFERAYREGPNGALAGEAMGRWLLALSAGDRSAARGVAADYLRRFPNGPEAAAARELLR